MKPRISKYSLFRILLSSEVKCQCAATASVLLIQYVEYTIGVKDAYAPDRSGGTCPFSSSLPLPEPLQKSDAGRSLHLS